MEELENTVKYEKSIGLKTIGMTFVRRWKLMLCIFIPIAAVSALVTQVFMTKTYQSSVNFTNTSNISAQFTSIQGMIKNKSITDKVSENLKTAHKLDIASDYIYNNISFSKLDSANTTFSVYFQSTNKGIVQLVMSEVANEAYTVVKSSYANMTKTDVTVAKKNSKDTTYMIIGFAIAVVFALGFPFAYEIVSDEVYDKDDVNNMGGNGFEVTVLGKKK